MLLHKPRESIWHGRDDSPLTGEVEIDDGYVYRRMRPKNKKKDGVNRSLAENQNPQKCIILVLR